MKEGYFTFYEIPGLLSGEYTLQTGPQYKETWQDIAEKYSWAGYTISKKYPKQQQQNLAEAV